MTEDEAQKFIAERDAAFLAGNIGWVRRNLVKRLRELGDHASFEPHMHHTAADRIEELEAERDALAEKLAKAVETEMVRVCSAYAKDNNMTAATAIHDAWLCVQITIAELTSGEATTPVGREGDKDE